MTKTKQLAIATVCVFVAIIIRVLFALEPKSVKPCAAEAVAEIEANMVYVEGGSFYMGADSTRKVTLDSYWISATEVTQGWWFSVMGKSFAQHALDVGRNSRYGLGDNYPVYYVSWEEAMEFCRRLSEATGNYYTLPTEAQWEFAARGGTKSKGTAYSGSNTLGDVAWFGSNSEDTAHPVGQKQPNELGLYDMCGNEWELCFDWYDCDYGSEEEVHNPQGPSSGDTKAYRGGSWTNSISDCHIVDNNCIAPDDRTYNVGFRIVRLQ